MKNRILRLASALALGLLVAPAAEAGQAHGAGKFFERLDQDKDGAITRAELDAVKAQRFEKLDKNGDGAISRAEYLAIGEARFTRADKDGDGRITRAEAEQARGEHRQKKSGD